MFFTWCSPRSTKFERQPVTGLSVDRFRNAYSARGAQRFETGGDVYAVAHEIVALHDDIAEIDTDAKSHAARLGKVCILPVEFELDFGGAPNRLDGTCELGDDAVACASEHPSIVAARSGDQ